MESVLQVEDSSGENPPQEESPRHKVTPADNGSCDTDNCDTPTSRYTTGQHVQVRHGQITLPAIVRICRFILT